MKGPIWRTVQVATVLAVLAFVGLRLADQWTELSAIPWTTNLSFTRLAASACAVLVSYCVLIWTWQRMVRAWGEQLRFALRDWRVVGILDAGSTGFSSEIWGDADQLMQSLVVPRLVER